MIKFFVLRLLVMLVVSDVADVWGETTSITIDVDKPSVQISPLLYGIFFEDINRSGDGGLYGEMLENRSFEDFNLPMGWTLLNEGGSQITMTLDKTRPLNEKNPTCLRLDITSLGSGGRVGVINQGYKGISIDSKDPVPLPTDPTSNPADAQWLDWMKQFAAAQQRPENGLNIEQNKTYLLSFYARIDPTFMGPITASLERQDGTVLAS